jgi:hypothetical protein
MTLPRTFLQVTLLLIGAARCVGAQSNSSSYIDDELDYSVNGTDNGTQEIYADDDVYYDDYVYGERSAKLTSYLPKPFALLSMICSYVMIRELLREPRRGAFLGFGGTPINRMLVGMAAADIIFSIAYFLGTWPSPDNDDGLNGKGNAGTCIAQGFFITLGYVASYTSSSCLSVFYYLVVCRNFKDHDLGRWELWFHGSIWLVALGLAVYPIPLDLYHNSGPICWIESDPPGCQGDECVDGPPAGVHKIVMTALPFCFCFGSCCIMVAIMSKVRAVENKASRYMASSTVTSRIRSSSATNTVRGSAAIDTLRESTVSDTAAVNRRKSNAGRCGEPIYLCFLV